MDELNLRVYDEKTKADLGLLRLGLVNLLRREGMEYFNQPFKLKRTGLDSSITLHLQLFFTEKVLRPIRTRRSSVQSKDIDLDSVSLGEDSDLDFEPYNDSDRLQKLSIISGGSVESLAQPELRQRKKCDHKIDLEDNNISGPRILVSLKYDDAVEMLAVTIHNVRT